MADAVSVHQVGESPPLHPRGVSYAKPIEAAKEAVTVMELAERLFGGPLSRNGRGFKVQCPLPDHDDKTPSFTIYADNERGWYCYGCGRGGDVVHLAQLAWEIERADVAAAELLLKFGHEVPQRPPSWYARQERQRDVRDELEAIRARSLRRRLFRMFEPMLAGIPDEAERAKEAEYIWAELTPLAARLVERRRT